jgi:hypothetical protein
MNFSRLGKGELISLLGAVVLVGSLWLPWFKTSDTNPNSKVDAHTGLVTAWEAFQTVPWLLIPLALAPFVLAWIVIRGHEIGWQRGEVTAIFGLIAFGLVLCNGVILGRPGFKPVDVGLHWGYAVALLAGLAITAGGLVRQAEAGVQKQPPGV